MKTLYRAVSLFIIFLLAIPMPVLSQDVEGTAPAATFTKEELAQMLAPIALYPDSLLAQVLMASTYPLEVIEADRWIKQNQELKGSSLDEALKDKDWDPSVQSLCYFPTVLSMMSSHITQITKVGNAFLAQQKDVMDMIQELRAKAQEQGNLKPTSEQNVVEDNGAISIEPSNPEVIYVPEYDPFCVYGPWWYPAYPPYFWGPAPIGSCISFYPGFFVGFDIGSWCFFDWPRFFIFIDFDRRHRFHRDRDHDREHDGRRGKVTWHHDPAHRRGVAYMDKFTAKKFGQAPSISRETGRNARGFPERLQTEKQTTESIQRELQRGSTTRSVSRGAERGGTEIRRPGAEQGGARVTVIPKENVRDNAFSRTNEGREELRSSERGRTSRESFRNSSGSSGNISMPRQNTGGTRGGGSPSGSSSSRGGGSPRGGSSSSGSGTPHSSGGGSSSPSGGGSSGRMGR